MLDESKVAAKKPVLTREPESLPPALARGAEIPENLDPLADGVLMKHQADWLADKSDLKLGEKGRRTGITFAEALDATLIAAAARSAGGDNYFYIGDTKDKGREFIGYVAHFAKVVSGELAKMEEFLFEDEQPDGTTKYISAFRIRFKSGYRVEALSSNPANIRGLQGVVCIDEAAFHRDVREVIDAVNALLIWGGRIRVISTHNGVLNPFNELVKEARAKRVPFKVHFIPFAKAIENGLFKRVCLIKGKTWSASAEAEWEATIRNSYGTRTAAMKQELDAIPAESEGAALTGVQIEACMQPNIPVLVCQKKDDFKNQPKHLRKMEIREWCEEHLDPVLKTFSTNLKKVFGHDFARTGDVSAFVLQEIGADLVRRDILNIEMSNIPFEQQKQILWYVLDRIKRLVAGALDASGNGAWLAEVTRQKYGELIHEIKFSQEWYRQEMPHYITAFEDGTLVKPKSDDVLMDHRALQYVNGIIKVPQDFRFRGSDGRERHGDTAIAGALSYFASRQDYAEYGYEAVGDHRTTKGTTGFERPEDDMDENRDWWEPPLGSGLRGQI